MKKVVIHWKISDVEGHGQPVKPRVANAWVKKMNLEYGQGTHWIEEVKDEDDHFPRTNRIDDGIYF